MSHRTKNEVSEGQKKEKEKVNSIFCSASDRLLKYITREWNAYFSFVRL